MVTPFAKVRPSPPPTKRTGAVSPCLLRVLHLNNHQGGVTMIASPRYRKKKKKTINRQRGQHTLCLRQDLRLLSQKRTSCAQQAGKIASLIYSTTVDEQQHSRYLLPEAIFSMAASFSPSSRSVASNLAFASLRGTRYNNPPFFTYTYSSLEGKRIRNNTGTELAGEDS